MINYRISIVDFWAGVLVMFPEHRWIELEMRKEEIVLSAFSASVAGGYVVTPTSMSDLGSEDLVEALEDYIYYRMDYLLTANIAEEYDMWSLELVELASDSIVITLDSNYARVLQDVRR